MNESLVDRAKDVWHDLFGGKPVQAELHGQAQVHGSATVTINIPGAQPHTVNVPLKGVVNANGPGSLGVSSPDADAPSLADGHE